MYSRNQTGLNANMQSLQAEKPKQKKKKNFWMLTGLVLVGLGFVLLMIAGIWLAGANIESTILLRTQTALETMMSGAVTQTLASQYTAAAVQAEQAAVAQQTAFVQQTEEGLLAQTAVAQQTAEALLKTQVARTAMAAQTAAVGTPAAPTLVPGPTATLGETVVRKTDGMIQILIPAGTFQMGSDDGEEDEQPMHMVYLDAYWIDQTEVTNHQYAQCVAAGVCTVPKKPDAYYRTSNYGNPEFSKYPVVNVSWEQAQSYCKWAGGRLPTEAEWEKAARGTDGRKYPWGNEFNCKMGNFDDEIKDNSNVVPGGPNCDGYQDMAPVGIYPQGASPYGALDMAGNVWEWTADWYGWYPEDKEARNPTGPESGDHRTVRGGSWWLSTVDTLKVTFRDGCLPDGGYNLGFRCAR